MTQGVTVVGYGRRAREVLVPGLLTLGIPLVEVIDVDPVARWRARHDLSEMGLTVRVDARPSDDATTAVVIAVPHAAHAELARHFLARGNTVLKEKPYALSYGEAQSIAGVGSLCTLVPRPHSEAWSRVLQTLPNCGPIHRYKMRYVRVVSDYAHTWRNDPLIAGGGVVMDMGYHLLDLAIRAFGDIETIRARDHVGRRRSGYKVEEEAMVEVRHANGVMGEFLVSRLGRTSEDAMLFEGSAGYVMATQSSVVSRTHSGTVHRLLEADKGAAILETLRRGLARDGLNAERAVGLAVSRSIEDFYSGGLRVEVVG